VKHKVEFIAGSAKREARSANVRTSSFVLRCSYFIAALLILGCGKSKPATTQQPGGPAAKPVQGNVSVEIQTTNMELGPNEVYTIYYVLKNGLNEPINVYRIETNHGPVGSHTQGWRQGEVDPNQSAIVAQMASRTPDATGEDLTATFVTDHGSYDAPVQHLTIAGAAPAAPTLSGPILAELTINPDQVTTSQPATLTYYLTDSSGAEIRVLSIETDSSSPLLPGVSGWMTDAVPSGTKRTIVHQTVVETEPGTYTFHAKFNTNRGGFNAPPVTLTVNAPAAPDTGHATGLIVISPNPCPVGADYTIDYEVVNTTLKDVTVAEVRTDLGLLNSDSPEWRSGTASAGQTTTIAEISGTGGAVSSRNKTATFVTDKGAVGAPSVLLIVQ
jgi:hypothetical protein